MNTEKVDCFYARLKKSGIGGKPKHKKTLSALGLSKFGKTVKLKDTPQMRGMLYSVVHLVDIVPSKEA